MCFFSQFIASHALHVGDRLVYGHYYWLAIFWTTNNSPVLARERLQSFENSWKKTTIFKMNTMYNPVLFCPKCHASCSCHIAIYFEMICVYRLARDISATGSLSNQFLFHLACNKNIWRTGWMWGELLWCKSNKQLL